MSSDQRLKAAKAQGEQASLKTTPSQVREERVPVDVKILKILLFLKSINNGFPAFSALTSVTQSP